MNHLVVLVARSVFLLEELPRVVEEVDAERPVVDVRRLRLCHEIVLSVDQLSQSMLDSLQPPNPRVDTRAVLAQHGGVAVRQQLADVVEREVEPA